MLATQYNLEKPKITFPCFVQPKIDGLRCLIFQADDEQIRAQSRTGINFKTLGKLTDSLREFFRQNPHIILDGELFSRSIAFETLAGRIKQNEASDDEMESIRFYLFDIISDEPFEQRAKNIAAISENSQWNKFICQVPTFEIEHNQFNETFIEFTKNGYEGIILRNKNGLYRQGFRSTDLQKYKTFIEEEFEIVDFKSGSGREKDCVIWICRAKESDHTFSVRPRGTVEDRREWLKNSSNYIGNMLTVIFQEYSSHQIPRFPVGKSIRNGW